MNQEDEICMDCPKLYDCDNNAHEEIWKDCDILKNKLRGDYDVERIVNELEKEEYYDERPWNTVLLKDVDNYEHYVIRNIYIDEDDDIIFEIKRL